MLRIEERWFGDLSDYLGDLGRDLPKATAMTLTWMGQAAQRRLEEKIPAIFDRPVPWTVKSTFLKAATASTLEAVVWIKDGSLNSLAHHIDGGKRPAKGIEKRLRTAGVLRGSHQFVVPGGGVKLDQYGNMPRGQINKILSAMQAQLDPYANTPAKGRNKNQDRYFLVRSREERGYTRRGKKLHPGIWWAGEGFVKPMLLFVKSTTYQRRYPFFEIAEDAAYDAMPEAAAKALDRLIK